MEYSVLYNEDTNCFEMVYWERLADNKRVAFDRTDLTARTKEAAEREAEEIDAMLNMPEEAMPTDAEINEMAEYYGYGSEGFNEFDW